MDNTEYYEKSLQIHALYKGKIETAGKTIVKTQDDLATVYLPGVEEPCMLIAQDPDNARRYSIKANTVAVVSDGSAVSVLGNIGGLAALPAAEGKAVLLKEFGNLDAFPICLDTQETDGIVETVKNIAPGFGGIFLESVAAPKCFEIEKKLSEELSIPVFSDRYGTAVALSAAVINAFKLAEKPLSEVRAVVAGAGALGNAVAKMLKLIGIRDIVVCDSKGILSPARIPEFGEDKIELLEMTNKESISGGLEKAVKGRDLFIGVSKQDVLTEEMVKAMRKKPVVFAMAKPEPEITPELAKAAGADIVGTGLADGPNSINSVLAAPGIMRGAIDAGATEITVGMLAAAAYALAGLVSGSEITEENLLPPAFGEGVCGTIAKAVAKTWNETQK